MIDLYFSPTPNGLKVRLFLEETGLPYRVVPVSLSKGEQFAPAFLAISPNNKIPAIVDHAPAAGTAPAAGGPLPVFESGAILLYLAEKSERLLGSSAAERVEILQWLFWQMAGLGPMAGQSGYFRVYANERVPFAIDRYTKETARLYRVLDTRLAGRTFIAGDSYSIADIACYPWIVPHAPHGQDLRDFPNLQRWYESIRTRPATQRVYEGVDDVYTKPGSPVQQAAVAGRS
ncbi:thiol:disulfide oxidoreductase [Paraburkholderia acidicola]|uniref:Thiol:disulfide oxidoreductase n=1 Tax=Paraburkholderia acidicola TaxID=1912599 RepID=A0A2A4EP71_9BURK|nr:glutathione binding-like protein [Paraburkholderia acidicola]PCE21946.1 thiol:disulfide oxidoreductase [Paraburkholderia acidicola]